jgi:di/tricarboxylate transporter
LAVLLFTTERVPVDLAAILVMVLLILLEPWTRISVAEGISGFSNPATVTVLAMLVLSAGVSKTGAAALLGETVAASAGVLPIIGVPWVVYAATSLLTNVIWNNASVVLMIPVAIEAAQRIDANAFAFVFAAMFAASTAFMTPVGYQTNLFVYGAGGYRFSDYFRVGAPLQLLLSVVTVLGIAVVWPL